MDFLRNLFKKKQAETAPSSSKPSKSTLSNSESKQVQGIMKARACDLCGNQVEYPNGFCLPVKLPSQDELMRDMRNLHAMIDVGLSGVTHQRPYNYFACEQCVNKLHQSSGVTPDKLELEMAKNKASYLWETELREKTMRPDEYPYSVDLDFSVLHNPFVSKGKAMMAETTDENEKIAIYTNIMARELQFQRLPPFSNPRIPLGTRHIAITCESSFVGIASPYIEKFIDRWFLKDIGKSTVVYCSQYILPRWFSYQMVENLAAGIAYNVPDVENRFRKGGQITWDCFVNTNGGQCMTVFWD